MIRRIFIWVKISIFALATILLAVITPASSSAAVQLRQDIPTSIITSTVSGAAQTFNSDGSSAPLDSVITSTWTSQYQTLLTSVLPTMSTPLSTTLFSENSSLNSISTAGLLVTVEAKAAKVEALRQAQFLMGEGDRVANKVDKTAAREKWLAAADAFARASDQLGVADAYLRLADSYQFEAVFSRQKLKLAVEYYLKVITAGADVYEELIQKELALDQPTIKEAEALYERAQASYAAGDCAQALPLLDQARQRYRQAKLGSGEVRVLTITAICQMEAENYLGSLSTLLKGLLIAQSLPMGEPLTERYLKGSERYEQGDFAGALTIYEEVRQVYQERNDQESTAETLLNLGNTYAQLGEYGQAAEAYQQALDLFLELQARNALSDTVAYTYADYNEAATRHNLGNLATTDGRYTEAVAQLEQAIALWQASGEPANEVSSMNSLGLAWRGLGDYDKAMGTLKRAWDQQQHLSPDLVIEGDIRNNIGYVYYSQGNFQQALAEFDQALQTRRQLPEPQRSQKVLETNSNIATVYADLSRFDEALTLYQQVLDQIPAGTPANLTTPVRANIAAIYIEQGDYQQGIATYEAILPDLADKKLEPARTAVLQNLGAAHLRTGQLTQGETYLLQARAIFTTTGDLSSVASIDNNLGWFYAQLGRFDEAKAHFETALTIWQKQDNSTATAKTLGHLALIATAENNLTAAIAYGENALDLSKAGNVPVDQARIVIILGLTYLKAGDLTKAQKYGKRAQALAHQVDDPATELGSYLVLATAHLAVGDIVTADKEIRAAIERLESLQVNLTVADLKTAYLNQLGGIYDLAVLIALANHQLDQAFLYTEQARVRAFLDQLDGGHIDFQQSAQSDLIGREQAMRRRITNLQSDLSIEKAKPLDLQSADAIANWAKELEAVSREQSQLLIQLQVANPAYAALVSADVISLAEVQQTVIDKQSTLIVYFLPNVAIMDKPLVWVIDQQAVNLVNLDIAGIELQDKILFLRNLLQNPKQTTVAEVDALSANLYTTIFAPLKSYIHQPNLIIAPYASLYYLPFSALWNPENNHYLIEDYTVTYIPSASVLPLILAKRNRNHGQLLALGNPDGASAYAETEVRQVAELYNTRPLFGKQATESQIVAQAVQADLIHLAAYTVYNQSNPLYTRIELAPDTTNDGNLEMLEIFDLDLNNANLLVLSAYETALDQQSRGDEIVGLTRAFFYAGTLSVVMKSWGIDDAASAMLMKSFYSYLQEGLTVTESLRNAQLEILANEKWRSPYYWAAFNVMGDYIGAELALVEAQEYLNVAKTQMQEGNHQTAIANRLQALRIYVNEDLHVAQVRVHFDVGDAYLQIGNLSLAEKHFHQALQLSREINNSTYMAEVQSGLGWLAAQANSFTQAETQLKQVLTTWPAHENQTTSVQVLEKLALIAIAQGDTRDAFGLLQEALILSEQASKQPEQVRLGIIRGIAYFKLGNYTNAMEDANRSLQSATELGDQLSELGSHVLLAMIHAANNEHQKAYEYLLLAASYLEGTQGVLMAVQLQTTFLHQLANVNTMGVLLSVVTGQLEQAFQYAEQIQEHGFLEISNQRFDLRANADPDLIRLEQTLRQRMAGLTKEINQERTKPSEPQRSLVLSQLQNDLEEAQLDYVEIVTLLRETSPDYVATLVEKPVTIERVQQELLDERTILIKYAVMESETLAWVVDRTTVTLVHIPVTRRALETQIKFLRNSIDAKEFDAATAGTLYTALIQPLKQHIRYSNLIIVSNGILQQLPFPALRDTKNGRYLAQDYAITQIPSVSELEFIMGRRNPNQGKLLALGNPSGSLPFAQTEAETIVKLYGGAPLLGSAASESQVYAQAGQVDILHLAALGVQNPLQPLFAYIELAPDNANDGKLEVHEIYNQLDLKGVNLVVVTASDVRPTSADETTSFAQAFLYAGAPNVVTSQWTVDDQATAFLMEKFYTYLRDGMDTPEALHRAQIDTLQQPQYANPYYWAGFTLVGDYKNDYAVAVTSFVPWPWIASISTLVALFLFSVGFVYVRIAQPNNIPIPEALQLLRLSITTKGGYLVHNWSDFQYRIQKALFEQGIVTGNVLRGLPTSLWTDALRRYYLENPELALFFDDEQQLLKHRKFELIQTFNRAWENIQQAITNGHTSEAGINQLVLCLEQLVDLKITIPAANQIGPLRYFVIKASPAFPDLPRIKLIPLMVHEGIEWRENDLDDIRQILRHAHSTEHPLSTQSIGVLISFIEPIKIQDIKVQIDKKLRRTYACDVNLLDKEDILNILFQKDARRSLASAVLKDANLEILSPYQTEGPVSPDAFFGRESELRKITENVHRHSYAIIGGRKIGKSSLWLQLHQRRLLATDFYTLVLDCQTINSYEQFLAASVQEGQARLPLPLPTTVTKVLESLPLDKPLIILLDEADKLIGPDRQAHWPLFNHLRSLINSGRMQMILFGEYTLHAALQDDNGPLYNLVESMILGVLEYPAVEELVTRPMKQLRIDFVDEAAVVQRIYQFTSGHPAIVQSLCNLLVARHNEQKTRAIGVDDVNSVIETPQFQDEEFLKVYLAQATPLEEIIVLLLAHHPGIHRLTEILKLVEDDVQIYPGAEATRSALDRLVNLRSILRYSSQGYAFAIEAFPHVLANSVTVADQLAVKLEKYKQEEIKA